MKVLITGATGSVGESLVSQFLRLGHSVVGTYFSNEERALGLKKVGADMVQADFRSRAFIDSVPGDCDVLVNNAGVNISSDLLGDLPVAVWDVSLAVNLTAPFLLINKVLPYMTARGWGRIVNISSIYGLRGCEGNGPYNVSKHGMAGLTKTIAKEYAFSGITCNEVCPGPIESRMMERIIHQEATAEGLSDSEYRNRYYALIPDRQFAKPDDVAALVAYLCSQEASHVNGVSLPVDGGWIA